LRAKGHSIRKIAKKLHLSPQTLSNWASELEGEIARLKAIELEALFEKYHLVKEHKVKIIGDHIKKIQDELKKRDFTDVPTEKLIDLYYRLINKAGKEYVEPKHLSDYDIKRISDDTGAKMDSEEIGNELTRILLKYRKGLIPDSQIKQEINLIDAILKAEDQIDIQKKLASLHNLLERG
jgi:hypothetical protein